MGDSAAACARGRARSSRSRTQGEAFGGAKGEPEDADPAPISRVIHACGVVESAFYPGEARVEPVGHVVHDLLALGLVQDLVEEAVVALKRLALRPGPPGPHPAAGYRYEPVRGAVHHE